MRRRRLRGEHWEGWASNPVGLIPFPTYVFSVILCCVEKLANTERHLDVSKGYSARASDRTDELKQLNRSIFRPVITFNKDAKRAQQEARVQARYEEEREEREKAMMDVRESQNRIGRAQTYGRDDPNADELLGGGAGGGSRRFRTQEQLGARKTARSRYQFEATASDDEVEDEIDDNLDEISDATKRLRALGMAMGQELDVQNRRIDVIGNKTDGLDLKIAGVTARVSLPLSPWEKTKLTCISRLQQKKF